jgi:hypothetical protein
MAESKKCWGPLKEEFIRRGWPHDRIENKTGEGFPDVIVSIRQRGPNFAGHHRNATEAFLELKHVSQRYGKGPRSPKDAVSLGLRPEQFLWLRGAILQARRAALVAVIETDWYVFHSVEGFKLAKKSATLSELANVADFQGVKVGDVCDYLFEVFRP